MHRNVILAVLIGVVLCGVFLMKRIEDDTSPGAVLSVIENRVPVENENLPTSPGDGKFPAAIYLNAGDKVRVLFDPVYEYSVDGEGRPIRTRTPFRKVEIEILSGPHEGLSGFVPRGTLARRAAD